MNQGRDRMTETMLVRTADGAWEELKGRTTMPDGGIVEVFGDDIGPVLGSATPVIVAACAPPMPGGGPDAICLDPDGGIWIVQLALDGTGEQTLGQLLAHGGALSGMSYEAFEQLCDTQGVTSLAQRMEERAPAGTFHRGTFEVTVADALSHGRFRLVSIVRDAPASLVQSMRFLNASGASVALYEASSFASASVIAVSARAIDVGLSHAAGASAATAMSAAGFVALTGRTTNEATASLMTQMQKSCSALFDDVRYEGDTSGATMTSSVGGCDMLVAGSDGAVIVSFESLGELDANWSVRAELCQGMERLLGADLGDVRKISQLNLSINEHLMDATLMEALVELLGDTIATLKGDAEGEAPARARARAAA